jgi:hypothetical protein
MSVLEAESLAGELTIFGTRNDGLEAVAGGVVGEELKFGQVCDVACSCATSPKHRRNLVTAQHTRKQNKMFH